MPQVVFGIGLQGFGGTSGSADELRREHLAQPVECLAQRHGVQAQAVLGTCLEHLRDSEEARQNGRQRSIRRAGVEVVRLR